MVRMEIHVNGIVQGVGFRPFIHKLVREYGLFGYVKNTSSGVIIEVEGDKNKLQEFTRDIKLKSPKLSVIENIDINIYDELMNYEDFKIIKSTNESNERFTLISPDVCTCEDCQRELFDKSDRRYRFPFINCTNCGPRFSIINDIPYDRDKTTMSEFIMCDDCSVEYKDIEDRRYHAQPDCCFDCGPELYFTDRNGNIQGEGEDPIKVARSYIKDGKIIAIKGLGGFHLSCSATNIDVVNEIRKRKQRDEKPFAIMCRDVETARKYCNISEDEKILMESSGRPIVLLEKKNSKLDILSPDNNCLGVMLPYTPVHFLLLESEIDTIVMTSGNVSDTPIIYKNKEAYEELSEIADGFLINNRDIHVRCDDSLIRVFEGKEYPLRRSRGYVPFPIKLKSGVGRILACGAEQKATFGITRDEYVFLSQHIGDMKNIETLQNYEEQIKHFENIFDAKPSKIVCDYHPDYMSTEYGQGRASKENIPLCFVQHHHAHMASCMADNEISNDVIGVIWDGTGYGTDGNIWGGEFLVGGYKGFTRAASIRPIMLPGGEMAIKEIYRISYGMLYDTFGYIPQSFKISSNADIIEKVIEGKVNCPLASSIGRLFDGVCSLIGIKTNSTYEGQGAVALEGAVSALSAMNEIIDINEIYDYTVYNQKDMELFDWRPMVREILGDIEKNIKSGIIASKFMNTLVKMSVHMVANITANCGIKEVVLSGGVFQNIYILKNIKKELESAGYKVYVHSRVSTNDEGIALGQILIAASGGNNKCV